MPLCPKKVLSFSFRKTSNFNIFHFFPENLIFSKFPKFLIYHQYGRDITFYIFHPIYIDLRHTLDKVFFASSYTPSSKTLLTRPISTNVVFFFAGPSQAGLAIVSVLRFQTGGKPSTWFPPVGLVELYVLRKSFLH